MTYEHALLSFVFRSSGSWSKLHNVALNYANWEKKSKLVLLIQRSHRGITVVRNVQIAETSHPKRTKKSNRQRRHGTSLLKSTLTWKWCAISSRLLLLCMGILFFFLLFLSTTVLSFSLTRVACYCSDNCLLESSFVFVFEWTREGWRDWLISVIPLISEENAEKVEF